MLCLVSRKVFSERVSVKRSEKDFSVKTFSGKKFLPKTLQTELCRPASWLPLHRGIRWWSGEQLIQLKPLSCSFQWTVSIYGESILCWTLSWNLLSEETLGIAATADCWKRMRQLEEKLLKVGIVLDSRVSLLNSILTWSNRKPPLSRSTLEILRWKFFFGNSALDPLYWNAR